MNDKISEKKYKRKRKEIHIEVKQDKYLTEAQELIELFGIRFYAKLNNTNSE